jgi:hypothetical protein
MDGVSRTVTVTGAELGSLTARIGQACRGGGRPAGGGQGLLAQATDDYSIPDETVRAVDLMWAMAWQLVRRDPPPGGDETWDVRV